MRPIGPFLCINNKAERSASCSIHKRASSRFVFFLSGFSKQVTIHPQPSAQSSNLLLHAFHTFQ